MQEGEFSAIYYRRSLFDRFRRGFQEDEGCGHIIGYLSVSPRDLFQVLATTNYFSGFKGIELPFGDKEGAGLHVMALDEAAGISGSLDSIRSNLFFERTIRDEPIKSAELLAKLEESIRMHNINHDFVHRNLGNYMEIFDALGFPIEKDDFIKKYVPIIDVPELAGGVKREY